MLSRVSTRGCNCFLENPKKEWEIPWRVFFFPHKFFPLVFFNTSNFFSDNTLSGYVETFLFGFLFPSALEFFFSKMYPRLRNAPPIPPSPLPRMSACEYSLIGESISVYV